MEEVLSACEDSVKTGDEGLAARLGPDWDLEPGFRRAEQNHVFFLVLRGSAVEFLGFLEIAGDKTKQLIKSRLLQLQQD